MNKFLIYLAFAAAALLLVGCASEEEPVPEGTGMAAVHGSVVIDGEPVNAAAILLTPGGGVKITGSDGLYDFTGLVPGTYEMKVFKEGCQSLNKSIELVADRDEELVFTLAKSVGGLSVNKSYVDMGSNESNNVAGFTVKNDGTADISWDITNAARWITKIEPAGGTSPAGGATAVSFTIDRSRLSSTTTDNYATLLVRSTTQGDGSVAELLVTVFSTGDGTNTANDNSDIDYVMVGDLYVQTKDISDKTIDWESAKLLCENSTVGDFNDWRLPTIEELATIYNNKRAIGGFAESEDEAIYYWSSSQSGNNASTLNFTTGQQRLFVKSSDCRVRAVRKSTEPEVSILPVTDISEESVTFNGRIDNAGSPAYSERGFVYSTSHMPTVDDTKIISYTSKSSTEFRSEVKSLLLSTTYYIRAYALSESDAFYSAELAFNIENKSPVVVTLPVSDVSETSAVLHGRVDSIGIPAYSERGFVYSAKNANPFLESGNKIVVDGVETGEYSANLLNLEEGGKYYVRAYVSNKNVTVYGDVISFEIVRQMPEVSTLPVTDIGMSTAVLHGSIESEGIPAYTERGFVYSSLPAPTVENGEKVEVDGRGTGEFRTNVSGLQKDVTYYVRAYATNSEGTSYGDAVTFQVLRQMPVVSTLPVTDIGMSTAVLHGSIESEGIPAYTERGFIYSSLPLPTVETGEKVMVDGGGTGEFRANVSGLQKDVTYYVRAYATNSEGTSYGDAVTFQVLRQMPVVSTLPVTDIGMSTAVLHGSIESQGIPAYSERGFVYSTVFTNPAVETDEKVAVGGTGIGEFSANLSGLEKDVTYYVRAYAMNSDGTSYGNVVTFKVLRQMPVVKTLSVSNIRETSATLRGAIDSKGIPSYTERGFVYSPLFTNPTIDAATKIIVSGGDIGAFEANVTGLETETLYYVRAYAINSEGTSYGEVVSFRPQHPDYVILKDAGLMVQKEDLGEVEWESANNLCENSTVGGFTDWRLPTKEELAVLYNNKDLIGNFIIMHSTYYWSSSSAGNNSVYGMHFGNGSLTVLPCNTYSDYCVRAVRSLP